MSLLLLFGSGGAATNMSATTPTGASSQLVAGSVAYTAVASFRAAATPRSCRVLIRWYDGAGSLVGTSTGGSVTDSTSAWTAATVADTSPATATFAAVVVEVLAAGSGEVHYVDKVGFFQGTSPTWAPHQ